MFPYKKVIMVFPARLGDTIRYTPTIKLLKKWHQDVEIDVICLSQISASVLEYNPNINKIYVLPTKQEIKTKVKYYDIGINIHNCQEGRNYFKWLGINVINRPPLNLTKHAAQEALEFFQELLGCDITSDDLSYELFPQPPHFSRVKELLLAKGASPDEEILIGCHLGCHATAKRGIKFWKPLKNERFWPLENFVKLESEARKYDPRIRFILTGSKGEKFLGKAFQQKSDRAINLIGHTSVLELAALMNYLQAYITSDTGPLHVACATNVKLISLFIPKYLQRSSPFPLTSDRVVISKPSMEKIQVSDVLESLLKFAQ